MHFNRNIIKIRTTKEEKKYHYYNAENVNVKQEKTNDRKERRQSQSPITDKQEKQIPKEKKEKKMNLRSNNEIPNVNRINSTRTKSIDKEKKELLKEIEKEKANNLKKNKKSEAEKVTNINKQKSMKKLDALMTNKISVDSLINIKNQKSDPKLNHPQSNNPLDVKNIYNSYSSENIKPSNISNTNNDYLSNNIINNPDAIITKLNELDLKSIIIHDIIQYSTSYILRFFFNGFIRIIRFNSIFILNNIMYINRFQI